MRVLITGGGTAGHVNPALAIADIIMRKEPDSVVEYVGTEKGIEGRLVAKRGMKLHAIEVMGLRRSLSFANFRAFTLALRSRKKCKKIIVDFTPDVVIGTGGYVCWPLISAAASMGIPTVLHESNAEPGFAVKMLKNQADLILVNFESTKNFLRGGKSRVERVGMPVAGEFNVRNRNSSRAHISAPVRCNGEGTWEESASACSDALKMPCEGVNHEVRILSFGGSLGAQTLNLCVLELIKEIATRDPKVYIEHSCGTRWYNEFSAIMKENGFDKLPNVSARDYIYDMPKKMAEADVVICRSGAATLAEIAVAQKAAILIPSPNVTGDQQRKNARQLADQQAAIVLEDATAKDEIVDVVKNLIRDRKRIMDLEERVGAFAVRDCDEKIYEAISSLVKKEKMT